MNYGSDFNKEEPAILEKVQESRRPKIWFIKVVLVFIILIIWSLFILFPGIYSKDNYKKEISNITKKVICIFNEKQCITYKEEDSKKDSIEKENEIILDKSIKEGSFIINYKLKRYLDKEVIIYKWVEYLNQKDFDKVVRKDIYYKKINTLKDYIINKNK
jgi:hypothetical protein